MLLSFFLAESERKHQNSKNVIYAIEEPETSQHPNFQTMLMDTLHKLIDTNNVQILLTTHTPEIVKMTSLENLIFLQKESSNEIIIQQGNNIEIITVAETLGVLPYVNYKKVLFVEGDTDKKFFNNLNRLEKFKNIFDTSQLEIIPLGGSGNLQTWLKGDYFKNSNIKCLYFLDKDNKKEPLINKSNNLIKTKKR